jgi:hypothetical protein
MFAFQQYFKKEPNLKDLPGQETLAGQGCQ